MNEEDIDGGPTGHDSPGSSSASQCQQVTISSNANIVQMARHIHTGGERIESGYRYRSDRFAGIVEVLKMLLLYGKYVYIYMNVLVVMVSLKPMIALPVQ